jgi:glycerol kinase
MILAIDQGTTSTKAYRLAPDGSFAALGSHRHRQILPRPGWVEHDAGELVAAIERLGAAAGPVAAVGLANQGETVVAWDAATKAPIHNAIVWQDERTADAIARLRTDGIEALTLARAGLPLDAYFSATKLRWLLDHADGASALRRQGRLRLGTSDAFFLDRLAGVFATDVTTASRTSLMDLRTRAWDPELCAAFSVPQECLPEIRPTVAPLQGGFGTVLGAPLAASVVDQQAALYGHGCAAPGDIKITFGTGAFALGLTGAEPVMRNDAGLLPTCAWQIGADVQYALDGGMFTAGAAVDWLGTVGLAGDDDAAGAGPSAIARGLIFVPAQAGLGCPYWDRTARAAWFGIDLAATAADLRRAVLEGIALRAAQLARALSAAMGGQRRVCVDGGLTRSAYFTRFLADALGRPIEVATNADLTAFGVARLCAVGLGRTPPEPAFRVVEAASPLSEEMHARFAAAVERTRA